MQAVIDYQHLGLLSLAGTIEKGSQTAESFGQSGHFVVSRYDNRERGQITVYLLEVSDCVSDHIQLGFDGAVSGSSHWH